MVPRRDQHASQRGMSRNSQSPHEPSAVSEALRLAHASSELQAEKRSEITAAIMCMGNWRRPLEYAFAQDALHHQKGSGTTLGKRAVRALTKLSERSSTEGCELF